MLDVIIKRIIILIPLLFAVSVISFVIIELPPGDLVSAYMASESEPSVLTRPEEVVRLRELWGLDRPIYVQYYIWIKRIILHGDFGRSFLRQKPISELIGERIALTATISLLSAVFVWIVAIPIGIYSATHQYSAPDYGFTFIGFMGLSIPNFLFALVAMWIAFSYFGVSVYGLFSPEFLNAPWSLARVWDMLKHMWLPVIIVGTAGTAGMIRVVRGCLLDELSKAYVITARAKGVGERRLLFKYPVRMAVNPLISTIGWMLPALVGGEVLVSIVLDIPTTGPLLVGALLDQDMYLAGSIVLILSTLTVIGTLISDILLVWVDPRIRYEGVSQK